MTLLPTQGARPPVKPADVFWVEQVEGGERQKWRVFSPAIWGVWTHYSGGTSPCYENHNHCAQQHDPSTLRWKGYFLGWSYKLNKIAFCQLTAAAVKSWEDQLGDGSTLRGQTIHVKRSSKVKGRLSIEVCEYQAVDPKGLPPDVDPRKSLFNLWELTDQGHKLAVNPLRDHDTFLLRRNA